MSRIPGLVWNSARPARLPAPLPGPPGCSGRADVLRLATGAGSSRPHHRRAARRSASAPHAAGRGRRLVDRAVGRPSGRARSSSRRRPACRCRCRARRCAPGRRGPRTCGRRTASGRGRGGDHVVDGHLGHHRGGRHGGRRWLGRRRARWWAARGGSPRWSAARSGRHAWSSWSSRPAAVVDCVGDGAPAPDRVPPRRARRPRRAPAPWRHPPPALSDRGRSGGGSATGTRSGGVGTGARTERVGGRVRRQRGAHRRRRREAGRRVLGEALASPPGDGRRDVGPRRGDVGRSEPTWCAAATTAADAPSTGGVADEHLVQHHADGVEVAGRRRRPAGQLLGRGVARRAEDGVRGREVVGEVVERGGRCRSRRASPGRSRPSSTLAGLTSRWTMPGGVGGAERREDTVGDAQRVVDGQPAPRGEDIGQRRPVDELHDEVQLAASSPASNTATALGWANDAVQRASRRKRSRVAGSTTPGGEQLDRHPRSSTSPGPARPWPSRRRRARRRARSARPAPAPHVER